MRLATGEILPAPDVRGYCVAPAVEHLHFDIRVGQSRVPVSFTVACNRCAASRLPLDGVAVADDVNVSDEFTTMLRGRVVPMPLSATLR